MERAKEVRKGHWIYTDLVAEKQLKRAKELLSSCGVDPHSVRLELH